MSPDELNSIVDTSAAGAVLALIRSKAAAELSGNNNNSSSNNSSSDLAAQGITFEDIGYWLVNNTATASYC
jgi:hypothetical protein